MNDATLTAELPTLDSFIGYRGHPFDYGLFYGASEYQLTLPLSPAEHQNNGNSYTARALSIWNEAHNENARRDAAAVEGSLRTVDVAELTELRQQLDQMTTLATSRGQEIERLRSEQISGGDPRLVEFWDKANELAQEAGHCGVYDQLAQELGGPGRIRQWAVEVSVSAIVRVYANGRDADDAYENIDQMMIDDAIRDHIRDHNVSFEYYDAEPND